MLERMLLGWAAAAALMAVLWVVQHRRQNAGVVDVGWAFATALLAAWLVLAGEGGEPGRRWLVVALVGLWGLRLGWHLARRVASEAEDGRYRAMRTALGARAQPALFLFFQVQGLWALLFALPVWAAAQSPVPAPGPQDLIGVAIWLAALAGEALADRQLARFRRDPANRGRVCAVGLWRYSRHPNYFFEWLHWWAYVAIGLGSPWWWVTLAGVAGVFVFLIRLTGIPYTEQQALRTRGEAYRAYQRTTSAFVPWPPARSERGEHGPGGRGS